MLPEKYLTLFQNIIRDRRLVWLCILVFGLLLIKVIWQTTSAFLPAKVTVAPPKVQPIAKLPDIAQWHLFGNYQTIRASLLPKAALDVKLLGIFYAKTHQASSVLVKGQATPAKLYKTGQVLPGGAKIVEILPDSVVVRFGGDLQALSLTWPAIKFMPEPSGRLTGVTQ